MKTLFLLLLLTVGVMAQDKPEWEVVAHGELRVTYTEKYGPTKTFECRAVFHNPRLNVYKCVSPEMGARFLIGYNICDLQIEKRKK